jgi:signal transduction histidine kinase
MHVLNEQLTKLQRILIATIFFVGLIVVSIAFLFLDENIYNDPRFKVALAFFIAFIFSRCVKKLFQLKIKMTIIESQRQTCFEHNLATAKAEILQKQLFQAQKLDSLGQLTSGIAHDFNNILMGISGYTTLALLMNEQNPHNTNQEKIANYLQGIENCSEKAADLVNKMLIYCCENDDAEPIQIDPLVAITEAVEMLRSTITSCITIDFVAQNTPPILIDPTELHQLITNLVINARDAILHGKNTNKLITVGLTLVNLDSRCDACLNTFSGQFVDISVSDNGLGISNENISLLFDPFFTTKDVGKGTGLGLSVVSGIVHNAGGHILVESELEKGSRFHLLFPPAEIEN